MHHESVDGFWTEKFVVKYKDGIYRCKAQGNIHSCNKTEYYKYQD